MVLILAFVETRGCSAMTDIAFLAIGPFLHFVNDYAWYSKHSEIDKKASKIYIVDFLIVYNKRHFPVFSAVVLLVATSQYGKTHINRKYGKSMHILNKLKR